MKTLLQVLLATKSKHSRTDERWNIISRQLKTFHGIDRSPSSLKNYWIRVGRDESGIDERRGAKSHAITTSVEDPEFENATRREKRKRKSGDTTVEEDDKDGIEESIKQMGKRKKRTSRDTTVDEDDEGGIEQMGAHLKRDVEDGAIGGQPPVRYPLSP